MRKLNHALQLPLTVLLARICPFLLLSGDSFIGMGNGTEESRSAAATKLLDDSSDAAPAAEDEPLEASSNATLFGTVM
jgi:hypothetical protein